MRKYRPEALAAVFALLISTTAATAYAQPEEYTFELISGTYVDEEAGVEFTFPEGWSGFESDNQYGKLLATYPEEAMEEETDKTITLLIVDRSKQEAGPTSPSVTGSGGECTTPSFQPTTVSGVSGVEGTYECTNDGEEFKIKVVSVETEAWLVVAMYYSPLAEFDADVAKFDTAVDSLSLAGAVNSQIPAGGMEDEGTTPSMMSVMVAGESVDVSVESASTISAFTLDETSKTMSFNTDGSGAETTVVVGSVLEGPYTVLVDGQATRAEEKQVDGVNTLVIPHMSGAHEVTVTGTQVVPEFPVAIIGIVAAMIGTIAVLGRTKLMKGSL
jgi:hypothetical protein